MKNERTSKRIASIAAKYAPMSFNDFVDDFFSPHKARRVWNDMKMLAASALTQVADKPKRKAKK